MKANLELYTDGASKGNPGSAGLGLVLKYGTHEKEHSEGYRKSTNNRMELLAVIRGLELLNQPNQTITVFSDSKYVTDAINKKWIYGWIKKNFKGVKNPDLWQRYLQVARFHKVKFVWIKGHNNHKYNERCDQLAVKAAEQPKFIDTYYEQLQSK